MELIGQRNEETAQLFGGEQKPVVAARSSEPRVDGGRRCATARRRQ